MQDEDKQMQGFIYLELFYNVYYIQGYSGNHLK